MKIRCDFCKTEYSLDKVPSSPLKCALCGHVWSVSRPSRRGAWMTLIAASCALLSAIVFTVAIVVRSHIDGASHKPLLDAGASIEFNHTLSFGTNGVKKITVELQTGDK